MIYRVVIKSSFPWLCSLLKQFQNKKFSSNNQPAKAEQRESFCRLQLVKNKGFYCLKRQGFNFSPVIQKLSWPLLQFLWLHPTSNQHRLCLKGNEFQLGISKLMFQQDWQVFQSYRLCNKTTNLIPTFMTTWHVPKDYLTTLHSLTTT